MPFSVHSWWVLRTTTFGLADPQEPPSFGRTVCALSSRYFTEKPELFGLAMHLAKAAAASNFLDGWKTLEMCQAYLLLGAYSPPARRWEEDRTWFYTGLAFRYEF